jgi:hypothetical protein
MMFFVPVMMALTFTVSASTYDKLKEEVGKKARLGNPAFVGDYARIDEAHSVASIFKLPPCSNKECEFDFSSNVKVPNENALFTCSPVEGLKITFANNDKGYLFVMNPDSSIACSLRLEMKTADVLVVSAISCPLKKIGDCDRKHVIGEFKRLGRPSFDCGVLTPYLELSAAKRTICHDLELSKVDRDLEDQYEIIENKDEFHKAQTSFMQSREACGSDTVCLKSLYVRWREQIKAMGKR